MNPIIRTPIGAARPPFHAASNSPESCPPIPPRLGLSNHRWRMDRHYRGSSRFGGSATPAVFSHHQVGIAVSPLYRPRRSRRLERQSSVISANTTNFTACSVNSAADRSSGLVGSMIDRSARHVAEKYSGRLMRCSTNEASRSQNHVSAENTNRRDEANGMPGRQRPARLFIQRPLGGDVSARGASDRRPGKVAELLTSAPAPFSSLTFEEMP